MEVSALDVFRKQLYAAAMHSFEEIIEHFEGIAGLARALGISTQAISQWNGVIPESRAYQIEIVSHGKFPHDRLPMRTRTTEAAVTQ